MSTTVVRSTRLYVRPTTKAGRALPASPLPQRLPTGVPASLYTWRVKNVTKYHRATTAGVCPICGCTSGMLPEIVEDSASGGLFVLWRCKNGSDRRGGHHYFADGQAVLDVHDTSKLEYVTPSCACEGCACCNELHPNFGIDRASGDVIELLTCICGHHHLPMPPEP